MQVIFIASEMDPYCKVGGLGDVVGTLPAELSRKGISVKVILPAYGSIETEKYDIDYEVDNFFVEIAGKKYETKVSELSPKNANHEVIFIGNREFFDRQNVYTDSLGNAYDDNFLRFLFFQQAALKYIERSDLEPDLLHCHDNQAALIPVYLLYKYQNSKSFQNTKTILTLHNIGYQGITDFHHKKYMDLPEELFYPESLLEWYGQINPLKAGILTADRITTVSDTHAEEITTNERLSAGLMNVINSRNDEVVGILNGVDYEIWNPETDRHIKSNYSLANFDKGKKENKISLLKEANFSIENTNIPLIGIVSRLVEQKGISLIIENMEELLSYNLRIVILGSGTEQFHIQLKKLVQKFPARLFIDFAYNVPFSHRIIAGSDILLMPSRYEPCGITQMTAMLYGTVPVAHKTGGLADTITDMKNGFLFDDYSGEDLINAMGRALDVYKNRSQWEDLVINAMNSDFTWQRSVENYLDLYRQVSEKQ
ncbi:MAG: glycogen synthase [Candidatus Marinimicrobia bacterium]|nr:glycogen synthase [Candidatus Neomarinimicrobiota bacterium]